jgi:hypothetical protein
MGTPYLFNYEKDHFNFFNGFIKSVVCICSKICTK